MRTELCGSNLVLAGEDRQEEDGYRRPHSVRCRSRLEREASEVPVARRAKGILPGNGRCRLDAHSC